jgi:soluble P-type ATPase
MELLKNIKVLTSCNDKEKASFIRYLRHSLKGDNLVAVTGTKSDDVLALGASDIALSQESSTDYVKSKC